MIIKDLEKKIKLALFVALGSFVTSIAIVIVVAVYTYQLIENERKTIYIMENNIPSIASQIGIEPNLETEMKSHVNMFHMLFFTIPPDDQMIKKNMEKAIYLSDESCIKQYNSLLERGFYNEIVQTSSSMTIITDSIICNIKDMSFLYYGTQRIDRRTNFLRRRIVTRGWIRRTLRSENNPHGMIIEQWATIENTDIEKKNKL